MHPRPILTVACDIDSIAVEVADNGKGLPRAEPERLIEPYVTGRVKGSGLGLAIVKKIMEDHAGDLILEGRNGGGAVVRLVFGVTADDGAAAGGTSEADAMEEKSVNDGA